MSASFRERYAAAAAANRSLLCVGLDPDPVRLPDGVDAVAFSRAMIEATADLVCCYKPNAAFFEADGAAGWSALRAVIEAVPAAVPVLLDAKRGDVGHSAAFYARAAFEQLGAHAVTLSPYLGLDALAPFLAYRDRHSFVLCRTSNPSAGELQNLTADGRPLYEQVALLARRWNVHGNVGLVAGATYPHELARVRALCPDQLLLVPGVGAQEGDLAAAVRASVDASGGGALINASRAVLYAVERGSMRERARAARRAASELRDAINAARGVAV
ncbi:MAG: orotidine-5'-phosphate decarboxylase [Dehalococcoidia bacterium]|nr:orotidine-5'-phosphate decarboxylase [Dehalococcoidia bacterium]